jgi:hypothetical protein
LRQHRVIVAVRPRLLRDALCEHLSPVARLRILEDDRDGAEILCAVEKHHADAVIATMDPAPGLPPLVDLLLDYYPRLHVIGIHPHDQRACSYRTRVVTRTLPEFSPSAIADALGRPPKYRRLDLGPTSQ